MNGIRFQIAEAKTTLFENPAESPLGRVQARGAGALTTTELLSLLITPKGGRSKKDVPTAALEAAGALLSRLGSLRGLASLGPKELMDAHDLSPASAARLCAIAELARRFTEEDVRLAETLSGAEEAYRFLKPRLRDLPHEVFSVIFLNQKHGVLAYRELFRGSIHASSVHPREVVKEVLKENAAAVILAHNHPSGHVSPSPDDLRLTEDMKALLAHLDVRVVDHLIVGGNGYFSFAREGLLNG
ncbi:MAG: DNA repair protein RadC [Acidobacteriota bacterium]